MPTASGHIDKLIWIRNTFLFYISCEDGEQWSIRGMLCMQAKAKEGT
jgi:hypothetical protein